MVRTLALSVAVLLTGACGNKPDSGEVCDLLPGDLVISELMVNPGGTYDTGHEWFEIYNASSGTQVLDRLVLARLFLTEDDDTGEEVVDEKLHHVRGAGSLAAGEYFVFGDGIGSRTTWYIDYSYDNGTENFGAMSNTTGGIGLRCKERLIDEVWYSDVASSRLPEVEAGRSLSVDGGVTPDALQNDDGELWCSGGDTYDDVNLGSPGESNIACGFGACDQGGGVMRDVVRPGEGDLIVSEVFGDPTDTGNTQEWIEVFVAGSAPIDLNGLEFSHTRSSTRGAQVNDLHCVPGNPGEYLVVGATRDTLLNGGVTVDAVASGMLDHNSGLFFDDAGAVELRRGLTVIDTAEVPKFAEGSSMSLDPLELNDAGNDLAINFCSSQSTGIFDEVGTPGQANDPCGSACDDGSGLRPTVPPGVGKLVITEVYPDPGTPGTDEDREWIEVYVTPGAAVDLNGLVIELQRPAASSVERTLSVASISCITVPGDSHVVIGGALASGDGVVVDAVMTGDDLYNEICGLTLSVGGILVDTITYDDPGSGVSWSYSDDAVLTAVANNVSGDWCVATDTGVFTGTGSPGQANGTTCP